MAENPSQLLARYHTAVQKCFMVLTRTVTELADPVTIDESVHRFPVAMERAERIDEVEQIAEHLKQHLAAVRPVGGSTPDSAKNGGGPGSLWPVDPVTGLAGHRDAERAIEQQFLGKSQFYAVALVIDRLAFVNYRFGFEEGDKIMCRVARYICEQAGPRDTVFRWRGPAFLALLDGANDEIALRRSKKITSFRLEHSFESSRGSAIVSVSLMSQVFRFWEQADSSAARQVVDDFFASHTQEGVGSIG